VGAGPYGAVGGRWRGGVTVGPYGGVAAGRAVAVGHSTQFVGYNALRMQGNHVRAGWYGGAFTTGWYRYHVGAWQPFRWWGGVPIWYVPVWPTLATFVGITAAPIVYDYGSTTTIENNEVWVDNDRIASAEQYAQQATDIADRGRDTTPPKEDEWQPLGVFGLVHTDEKVAQNIFQLAVNKAGIIRGNYYNAVADESKPVYGSVDPKSQRAAWSIGDKKTVVFEAGLNNLTKEQTTVLVHYGKERTEQMVLVRLEEPKDKTK
jgi:hypothetical protein